MKTQWEGQEGALGFWPPKLRGLCFRWLSPTPTPWACLLQQPS